jgi:hypothetical protein
VTPIAATAATAATAAGAAGAATSAAQLAESASDEWSAIVSAAVIGTDRRAPPLPLPGWDSWATAADDPAVAVLDRAAAVVVSRRAGARPVPAPDAVVSAAPVDGRPLCPASCSDRLARILAGEHEVLLPEWLARCAGAQVQLPWVWLPTLLLRGRRQPDLDLAVRELAGGRAAWLAEIVPELGVKPVASTAAGVPAPGVPVSTACPIDGVAVGPTDGGGVVTSILQPFLDGQATWAAAPQLRILVTTLDPSWLPALIVELSHLSFNAVTERTRSEMLGLAEFRTQMIREFADISSPPDISRTRGAQR